MGLRPTYTATAWRFSFVAHRLLWLNLDHDLHSHERAGLSYEAAHRLCLQLRRNHMNVPVFLLVTVEAQSIVYCFHFGTDCHNRGKPSA